MKKILQNWRELSRFHKISIAAVVILAGLLVLDRIDYSKIRLPLPNTIQRQVKKVRRAQERLDRLEKRRREEKESLQRLKRMITPFVWQIEETSASVEIQGQLEKLAQAEGITIRSMGSARNSKIDEHLGSADLSVHLNGNMREIVRFLTAVNQSERKLYWNTCRLSPIQSKQFDSINLTGRVKAFYLTNGAERIIFGKED